MIKALFFLIFAMISWRATAQELLPQGVGLYQLGYRKFVTQEDYYNAYGEKASLGSKFDKEFDGPSLLTGAGGPLLSQLADELRKFDVKNGDLVKKLKLGSLRGDVHGEIDVKILGLAFGLNKYFTLYAGFPWVSAAVDADLRFGGTNNAREIEAEGGGAMYQELRDGLIKASGINTQQIKDSITSNGYAPIDHWDHAGIGDIRVGVKTGLVKNLVRHLRIGCGITTQLILPTGYTDSPDILTDVGIGKGYYSLGVELTPQMRLFSLVDIGSNIMYQNNFNTQRSMRVPEREEKLMAADRKATVNMQPGSDHGVAGFVGLSTSLLSAQYKMGTGKHEQDIYSGSMQGNYAALGEDSASYEAFYEVSASLSTAKAYQRKKFPVPFILTFTYHESTFGENLQDNRYYEISIASFFSTPLARPEKTEPKKVKRRPRKSEGFY